MSLLSKPTRGFTPIGLDRGMTRVGAETRRRFVQTWQNSKGDHPGFACSRGKTAADTVWCQTVRAEHSANNNDITVLQGFRGVTRWSLTPNCATTLLHPLDIFGCPSNRTGGLAGPRFATRSRTLSGACGFHAFAGSADTSNGGSLGPWDPPLGRCAGPVRAGDSTKVFFLLHIPPL